MRTKGTLTLTTPRLLLRRFTLGDAEAMFHGWAHDPQVTLFMRWSPHGSVNETANLIQIWLKSYERDDFYLWAIELKESGTLIGSIGLFPVNAQDQCFDTGYCIAKPYWNCGYVSEALRAVIDFGFRFGSVNRIEAYHSVDNPASGKVMQHCGMRFEGRALQKYKSNRGFEDSDMYAIVRSDWVRDMQGPDRSIE